MNWLLELILHVTLLAQSVAYATMPFIARKTIVFGVYVPEEYGGDEYIREIKKRFAIVSSIIGLISIALLDIPRLLGIIKSEQALMWLFMSIVIIQIFFYFIYYVSTHRSIKEYKAKQGWTDGKKQVAVAVTDISAAAKPISAWWLTTFAIVIAATVALLIIIYPLLPDPVPIHFNMHGVADGFMPKTPRTMLFIPAMQILMAAIFVFVFIAFRKTKRPVEVSDPEGSLEKFDRYRRYWTAFMIICGNICLIVLGLTQVMMIPGMNNALITVIITVLPLSIIGGAIWLSVKTGQSGARLGRARRKAKSKDNVYIDRDDDKYWKLGSFYYNPDDPAVFVEKRFGIGMTNNFARPASWFMIGGLILFIIASIMLPMLLT